MRNIILVSIITGELIQSVISQDKGNWKTKFVVEIITEGVKTPHTNPFNITAFNDFGSNELLPNGERMQYLLGNQIQVLYSDILNEKTRRNSIFLYSSERRTCQQSAIAHMMGIFPISDRDTVIEGFEVLKDPPFEPITVDRLDSKNALPHKQKPFNLQVESEESDFLFLPNIGKLCPKFTAFTKQLFSKLFRGLKAKDLEFVVLRLRKSLRHIEFFGKEIQEIQEDHLTAIYESAMAEYYYTGEALKRFNNESLDILNLAEGMRILGKTLKVRKEVKIYNHHKLKTIIQQFDIVQNISNYNKKFMLMSTDTTNMLALLRAFNKTTYDCMSLRLRDKNLTETDNCLLTPKPASSLVMEMLFHSTRKEYFVRMLYNGKTLKVCDQGKLSFCPYKQWKKEMQEYYMADNYFDLCGNDKLSLADEERLRKSIRSDTLTIKIMIGILFVQLLMFSLICYCKKKGEQRIVEEALMDTMKKAKFKLNY